MTPTNLILCCHTTLAKKKTETIQCPDCGDAYRWIRHGYYLRYRPGEDDLIEVPRFRCLNHKCERVTFSVLSHPCLRYKRHTLAFYTVLLRLLCLMRVNRLARKLGKSWRTVRRWMADALGLLRFLRKEGKREPWGPCPCQRPERYWSSFCRDLYRVCGPQTRCQTLTHKIRLETGTPIRQ